MTASSKMADPQEHMPAAETARVAAPVVGPKPRMRAQRILLAVWKHRWFALATFVVLAVLAWQVARITIGVSVVTDETQRGDLVKAVVASGHVETPYRVDIGSQITGIVSDVLVQEGQQVTKDQPLISIESSELKAAVQQAEGAVAQAQARMRQLRELTLPSAQQALEQAQATLKNAEATFRRTSQLAKVGHATQAALDDAQRALDISHTQVRAAQLQVYTNSPGGSDFVIAQTQLSQAEASLATARSRLSYATVVAPRDGVLISRSVERGSVVQPGKTLLVLAPKGETQLVVQIDEKNLSSIAIGQHALASADAYPNDRFDAIVTYINPGVDIARASVEVKLTVPNPPAYLRQDMTVSVDIDVARRNGVLIAPLRDLHDALTSAPWAMVVRDGRAHKAPVRIGLIGTTHAEVLDGLTDHERLIPSTVSIAPGRRVRPVSP